MPTLKRLFWPIVAVALAVALLGTATVNRGLRDQVDLLNRVAGLQERWCTGLGQVNTVCEETLVDLADRLGLDKDFLPLVTTALWRRSMGDVTVNRARRTLKAAIGSRKPVDDPKAAMGGLEELPAKR